MATEVPFDACIVGPIPDCDKGFAVQVHSVLGQLDLKEDLPLGLVGNIQMPDAVEGRVGRHGIDLVNLQCGAEGGANNGKGV